MKFTNADIVKLRERTGVGMTDCKKALEASGGNMEKAADWLREKGMANAVKREGRTAAKGVVTSYIHMGGKIGVLVEVNCETDFAAQSADFKEFAHNVALQIAATAPAYIKKEEVPKKAIENEKNILKAQALNEGKPAKIIDKMVEGRISKFYDENCLLEQVFVKDSKKKIIDLLNELRGKIGEKCEVRRFSRYELGEGL